ncbi:Salivary acidic proline-rich phosphoprotein 1/2 [Marasmius tenuissimus]|uniref:RNA helicase n=1 Tax=Marasmius tenuissimus TaxID=585030 RepID=A0ABR3A5B5_9AGAR
MCAKTLRSVHEHRKPASLRGRSFKRPTTGRFDINGDERKFKKKHSKANGIVSPMPNGKPTTSKKVNGMVNGVNGHAVVHMEDEADTSSGRGVATSSKYAAIQEQRANLPIARGETHSTIPAISIHDPSFATIGKEALLNEFREHDVTVLLGETGSGKTTQVPQYLLESGLAGEGMIAVTQPRRVAATSLAARVAAEQNGRVGSVVGYSVRFDERSSTDTRIKYLTDGMIFRELLSDPLLSKYSVVIVDEAHERSLRTDLLIANLKTIQQKRNDASQGKGKGKEKEKERLKIIIMSATLDAEKFAKFFPGSKIIYVQGRQHPVTIYHSAQGQLDYVDSAMRTFFQIHVDQPPGDVLIFLPGQEDIESLDNSIRLYANQLPPNQQEVLICTMYASQAPGQNAKVFNATPPNTRKCILATNIAETSITIPGVKYVIDTGKCKEKRYLAKNTGGGFDTLMTRDITKSSAMQRAGRAGREGPGFCFRLYTEESFKSMALSAEPEIMRSISALKTLFLIGGLDQSGEITQLGREMAAFPLEPVYSRAVLASKEYGCTNEVLTIIAVLSASSKVFVDSSEQRDAVAEARKKFKHGSGDHLTVLNVVRAYKDVALSENKSGRREWCRKHFLNERALLEANDIREQLQQTCERLGIDWKVSCGDGDEPVIQSFGQGLAMNTAFLQPDGTYKQTMGQSTVKIHPSSTLCDKKAPTIVYDEVVYTNQIYARGVSIISKSFLAGLGALKVRQA